MNRFAIAKEGRLLKLGNTSIDWDQEDDILDYDRLGQGFSWTANIPVKGNEWAFFYASHPANSTNKYKTYDGFSLLANGNVWLLVTVDLFGTRNGYYEIRLSTVPSPILQNIEKSIRSVNTEQAGVNTIGGSLDMANHNADPKGAVVFPFAHFYGQAGLVNGFDTINDGFEYLPSWRLFKLLSSTLKSLGYSLTADGIESDHLLYRLVIFDQNLVPEGWFSQATFDYKDWAPDTSIQDLMNAITFFTGSGYYIREDEKKVIIQPAVIGEVEKKNAKIDLTKFLDPSGEIEQAEYNDIEISYNLAEDSFLDSVDEEPADLDYQGVFDDVDDFVANSSAAAGNYGFCKIENLFYRWISRKAILAAEPYAHPFQPYRSGDDDTKSIECPYIPVAKTKYAYVIVEGSFDLIDDGSGKVEILDVPLPITAGGPLYDGISFEESGIPLYDRKNRFDAYTVLGKSVIINTINFTGTTRVNKLVVRKQLDHYVAMAGMTPNIYAQNGLQKSVTPRIAIWHGEQLVIDQLSNYPAAFADQHISNNGTAVEVDSYSLNLNVGKNNLFRRVWQPVIRFIQSTFILRFKGHIPEHLLVQLIERKKIGIYKHGLFRFRRLRARLTKKGITDQELEGYSL